MDLNVKIKSANKITIDRKPELSGVENGRATRKPGSVTVITIVGDDHSVECEGAENGL